MLCAGLGLLFALAVVAAPLRFCAGFLLVESESTATSCCSQDATTQHEAPPLAPCCMGDCDISCEHDIADTLLPVSAPGAMPIIAAVATSSPLPPTACSVGNAPPMPDRARHGLLFLRHDALRL